MRGTESEFVTSVSKEGLLEILEKNRKAHAKIVAEARRGYVQKAKALLTSRLKELQSGKTVELHFNMRAPSDHTAEYDSAIGMLRMSKEEEIKITFSQYRMFVEDDWDWMQDFLVTNSPYSRASASLMAMKLGR
jgi:hypothetical protein